jgi:sugar/nucleoside kinase (ribokinase family)
MILVIGEILVDLFGREENSRFIYQRCAGGAPFNVASAIKKLNGDVDFIGTVGDDLLGNYLKSFANNLGFKHIQVSKHFNTSQAFVEVDSKGERSFSFMRACGADVDLKKIPTNLLKKANIMHFGSLMLSHKNGRQYLEYALREAKKYEILTTFDVNYRSDIFKNNSKSIYLKYLKEFDILKFSYEEVEILSGEKDISKGLSTLTSSDQIVLVTNGSLGADLYFKGKHIHCDALQVKAVDTTGAGDNFFGAFLYKIKDLDFLDTLSFFEDALKFACIVGSLSTLKIGAVDSMPSLQEIEKFYNKS